MPDVAERYIGATDQGRQVQLVVLKSVEGYPYPIEQPPIIYPVYRQPIGYQADMSAHVVQEVCGPVDMRPQKRIAATGELVGSDPECMKLRDSGGKGRVGKFRVFIPVLEATMDAFELTTVGRRNVQHDRRDFAVLDAVQFAQMLEKFDRVRCARKLLIHSCAFR